MGVPSGDFTWPVGNAGTNPSVGINGNPIPLDSTLVGGEDPSLNLHPLQTDAGGNLKVAIATPVPLDVNLADVGGAAISLGQKVMATSLPVVIASNQSAVSVTTTQLAPALGAQVTAASTAVNIASDQVVPISAAALPLPTGAATSVLQTTGNTTLSTISGQLPATLGAHVTAASLAVNIASDQTVPVSIAGTITTTDAANGPVTPGAVATKSELAGGQFNTVLPTLTNTQQAAIQVDASGRILVSSIAGALPAGANNIGHVDGEGTAGTPAGGVMTVQGNPAGTPIPVTGSLTVGSATAFSTAVTALVAATATKIVSTGGTLVSTLIYNGTGATVWFGASSVTNSGGTMGIPVPDQGYFNYTNQADFYGYSVLGGNVVAMEET